MRLNAGELEQTHSIIRAPSNPELDVAVRVFLRLLQATYIASNRFRTTFLLETL